ncbi:hypothetical protein ACIQUY_39045 [Streptomyces sp. NPDC090231]|uniref:hypothetical protein n=1 Tax=unclassified Streptomyces TaxID=2593676 RepID=UPI002E156F57|nr:hypothetical protein OG384_36830 [Streptomyces sp. NBC_01324]
MSTPTGPDSTRSHKSQSDPQTRLTSASDPLLTSHAALILLAAVVIGAVVAVLAYLSSGNTAAAILAGLAGAGASTPVLHTHIGS